MGTLVSDGTKNRPSRTRLGQTGTTCGNVRVCPLDPYGHFGFRLTIIPARQLTVVTQSTVASGPPRRKDQDMGGFPGPIELSQRLMHTNAFGFINRVWNRILTRWRAHRQRHYLSWLPDGIDALIIGRNSEFYTDELTDEQLENLGGIEYRALRFLSYFVPAVSV